MKVWPSVVPKVINTYSESLALCRTCRTKSHIICSVIWTVLFEGHQIFWRFPNESMALCRVKSHKHI